MSKPTEHQAAPVHFMQKERLRAEAAVDPAPPLRRLTAMRLERAVAGGMDFRSEPFEVTDFALYESRLSPKGSHYDELARYPLG